MDDNTNMPQMNEPNSEVQSRKSRQIHHHLRNVSRVNAALAILALVAVIVMYIWVRPYANQAKEVEESKQDVKQTTQQVEKVPSAAATGAVTTEKEEVKGEQATLDVNITVSEYQDELNDLIADYAFDESATASAILPDLLNMRVPAEMRDVHLEVVFATTDAEKGEYTKAQERMSDLRADYAWLDN